MINGDEHQDRKSERERERQKDRKTKRKAHWLTERDRENQI